MNDEIEKLNAENDRLNKPSEGNFSKAANSGIKTNEQDGRTSMVQGIINDLSNQRADIDIILQSIQEMGKQINQITQILNQGINGQKPQTPEQGKINMETITVIGDLFEKGAAAWKSLRGNDNPTDDFTAEIVKRSKTEAMESLDIVGLINKSVKKKLVNDIAGDIVHNVSNSSKQQDTHAPQ